MSKITKPFIKRLVLILSLACLLPALSFSAVYAASATTTTGSSTSTSTKNQLITIIYKGTNEINRRLKTLNTLDSKISSSSKISTNDKATLTNQVNSEITNLTLLKSTLNACTTLGCAESAAQSVFTQYRVYALVVPQVEMIKTADDQQLTEAKLSTIASQLTTRLSSSTNSTLKTDLTTLNTDIRTAQGLSSTVESVVAAITPANFDNNHQILVQYYGDLKTAQSDNQSSYSLAKTIISDLSSGSSTSSN